MMRAGEFLRWNAENTEQLRKLWEDDCYSSGDIAHIMGISRNAVLGRIHRVGMKARIDSKVQPRVMPTRPRGNRSEGAVRKRILKMKLLPDPLPGDTRILASEAWKPIAGSVPVPLVGLEPGKCRWPVGDGSPHMFCGLAADGGPYCPQHHALSVGGGTPSERDAHKWREAA